MLTREQAKSYITKVREYAFEHGRKPETWYMFHNHVFGVAEVSQLIAQKTTNLNPERAYVFGLLHDAGRIQEQFEHRFHGLLGYEILKDQDAEAARASMLHMFSHNKIPPFEKVSNMFFENKEDYTAVKLFAETHPINDYDRLIQLADGLVNSQGIVTLEQRAVEFAKRHHVPILVEVINEKKELKRYFDEKIGENIYNLLNKKPQGWMLHEGADR